MPGNTNNQMIITKQYMLDHPDEIFVFGDNLLRKGFGGGAGLRHFPNTFGFITKKAPATTDSAYYTPEEYRPIFLKEFKYLCDTIELNPGKTFLISKIGAGLANRFNIWEEVIEPKIYELKKYPNVRFLF
jgi:hypothetical protein